MMRTNVFRWKPRTHFEQVPLAVVKRALAGIDVEQAMTDTAEPNNLLVIETPRRLCPDCGEPLEWIERNRLEQQELDYYHRCLRGCGLYCYDLGARNWIRLA